MAISRRQALVGAGVGLAGVAASQLFGPGAEVVSGRSRARPVLTDAKPPAEADVVIIGGGNIGAAAAFHFAGTGRKVVLCEKGAIGGEASGRSVGHVFSLGMDAASLAPTAEAKRLWPGLNAELAAETGFRGNGLLMRIEDEEGRAFWEAWLREARPLASRARILDRAEIARHVETATPWFGAIYDPTDGSAEPTLVAPAFAEAARRRGARLIAPCAVRGIETAGGRVSGVVTEHGAIRCGTVVLAGGAWSTAFLGNLGLRLPVGNLFSWCASFHGVSGPSANAIFADTTWRRQIDGGFTTSLMEVSAPITPTSLRYLRDMLHAMSVANSGWTVRPRLGRYFFEELGVPRHWALDEVSPFERRRILEPALNRRIVDRALGRMRSAVPAFAGLRTSDMWGGVLSSTADGAPVLGPISSLPGLIVATGFSEGLTMAPAMGEAIVALADGRAPRFDIRPFRYERYAA